jgi:hypothetical protein
MMKENYKQKRTGVLCLIAMLVMHGCSSSHNESVEKKPDAYGFFPVDSIYLGQTSLDDLWSMGYKPDVDRDCYNCYVGNIILYDNDKDRIFEQIYISYYSDLEDPTPAEWKEKFGFDRTLSCNKWIALFKKRGFGIEDNASSYTCTVRATSPDKSLEFELEFKDDFRTYDKNKKAHVYNKEAPASLRRMTAYYKAR